MLLHIFFKLCNMRECLCELELFWDIITEGRVQNLRVISSC